MISTCFLDWVSICHHVWRNRNSIWSHKSKRQMAFGAYLSQYISYAPGIRFWVDYKCTRYHSTLWLSRSSTGTRYQVPAMQVAVILLKWTTWCRTGTQKDCRKIESTTQQYHDLFMTCRFYANYFVKTSKHRNIELRQIKRVKTEMTMTRAIEGWLQTQKILLSGWSDENNQ